MFEFIRRYFRRASVIEAPIIFRVDRNDENQHVVSAHINLIGEEYVILDIDTVRQYGYSKKIESESGIVTYVVSDEDRQRLNAIHSVAPRAAENGVYTFDFVPRIFSFLRQASEVEESESSSRLHINETPLKPVASIRFDPDNGLDVNPGFKIPKSATFIPADSLEYTSDGEYTFHQDTFAPAPKLTYPDGQALLSSGGRHVDLADIPEFFVRDLVLLRKHFEAILIDGAEKIKISQEPLEPIVYVDQSVPGWLDFKVEYTNDDIKLLHDQVMQNQGQTFLRVDDSTWVKIPWKKVETVQKGIDSLGPKIVDEGYRLQITEFASLEEFIADIGGMSELGVAYQEFISKLMGFDANDDYALSESAELDLNESGIQLRPYQRAGIHWLHWLDQNHLHGILADDMGLGKTLQSIMALRQAYELNDVQQHSLILAPLSVLPHWEREFRRFYPGIRVHRYHGTDRTVRSFQTQIPTVFVTTYSTLANDIHWIKKIPFLYVILDEATKIKNPNALRSQAVKALNAAHRLALSGTPVENRPAELWSIYDFLMPGHLGKYGTFNRLFEEQIVAGDSSTAGRLGRRIQPFILRRLKTEVAKDLPEKIEMKEWCQLSNEQRALYGALNGTITEVRESLMAGQQVNYTLHILPLITKLKQICDHPALMNKRQDPQDPVEGRSNKFDWIMDRIDSIVGEDEQVVVFSHFLGMLDLLEKGVGQRNYETIRIDGSVRDRQSLIDRFNAGEARVALISIMSGGHGINLTAANHVIHADRWWNPAVENQATDRVHRIGQDKTVYVYLILVEGTLEERIDAMLEAKQDMADSIIQAATDGSRQWSREELLDVLQPLPE